MHHWTRTCSLGEGAAMMEAGLTLVTNATKHSTPMANVARLNTLLILAPVSFPLRANAADSTYLTRRVAMTLLVRHSRSACGVLNASSRMRAVVVSSNSFSRRAFNMPSRCQSRLNVAAELTPIMLKLSADEFEAANSHVRLVRNAGRLARSCDASQSFARGRKAAGGPHHSAKPPVHAVFRCYETIDLPVCQRHEEKLHERSMHRSRIQD
jgi:hypothetical protein